MVAKVVFGKAWLQVSFGCLNFLTFSSELGLLLP